MINDVPRGWKIYYSEKEPSVGELKVLWTLEATRSLSQFQAGLSFTISFWYCLCISSYTLHPTNLTAFFFSNVDLSYCWRFYRPVTEPHATTGLPGAPLRHEDDPVANGLIESVHTPFSVRPSNGTLCAGEVKSFVFQFLPEKVSSLLSQFFLQDLQSYLPRLSVYLQVYLFMSVCLSIYLSIYYLSIYLPTYLSINLSIYLPIYLSTYPFTSLLHLCLSTYQIIMYWGII